MNKDVDFKGEQLLALAQVLYPAIEKGKISINQSYIQQKKIYLWIYPFALFVIIDIDNKTLLQKEYYQEIPDTNITQSTLNVAYLILLECTLRAQIPIPFVLTQQDGLSLLLKSDILSQFDEFTRELLQLAKIMIDYVQEEKVISLKYSLIKNEKFFHAHRTIEGVYTVFDTAMKRIGVAKTPNLDEITWEYTAFNLKYSHSLFNQMIADAKPVLESKKRQKEIYEEMKVLNRVYYRLILGYDDIPSVVTMQWFDEYDYDQERFFSKKEYETEEAAEMALEKIILIANGLRSPLVSHMMALKTATKMVES